MYLPEKDQAEDFGWNSCPRKSFTKKKKEEKKRYYLDKLIQGSKNKVKQSPCKHLSI